MRNKLNFFKHLTALDADFQQQLFPIDIFRCRNKQKSQLDDMDDGFHELKINDDNTAEVKVTAHSEPVIQLKPKSTEGTFLNEITVH